MEGSMDSHRKLLEGKRVEVRQKELGLRGSWHSGVVVQVKNRRRVVEYDELFTIDQCKKLTETIKLPEVLQFKVLRDRAESAADKEITKTTHCSNERGFIRPLPPPCNLPSPASWKKGLLVDAFYDDAWWEGVLLEDVLSDNKEDTIRILFPDEGDELQIMLKNIRVSQEWDEASGFWTLRGSWSYGMEKNGQIDFSPLKQVCSKGRGSIKWLWRQRNFNEVLEWYKASQNNPESASGLLHMKGQDVGQENCGDHQDLEPVFQDKLTTIPDLKSLVGSEFVGSKNGFPVEPCLSKSARLMGEMQLATAFSQELENTEEQPGTASLECLPETGTKGARQNNASIYLSQTVEKVSEASCKEASESIQKLRKVSHPINKISDRVTRTNNTLNAYQEASGDCKPAETSNLDVQVTTIDMAGADSWQHQGSNGYACSPAANSTLLSESGSHNLESDLVSGCNEDGVPSVTEAFLLKHSEPFKNLIKQARLSAKKFLLDTGWTVETRVRFRNRETEKVMQDIIYVSPTGRRYGSLAAACRALKTGKNDRSRLAKGIDEESKLLSAYNMHEGFKTLYKAYRQQIKKQQLVLSVPSRKHRATGLPVVEGRDVENSRFATDISKDRQSLGGLTEFKSFVPVQAERPESGLRDSKPFAEKSKKRKSDCHSEEERSKRGRPSIRKANLLQESKSRSGQGGCRMQVLLSSPEAETGPSSGQDSGGSCNFKRSTVLSWLIDKGIIKENEPVCYVSRKDGHVMKKGHVTREGVICKCCKDTFTLSNFEAHAGSKLHRPSANIFLDDGRSIADCQLQACALHDAKEKKETCMDISDDTCGVCGDGGELILCDHCPSTFHPGCIDLQVIPEGDWYCPRCSCGVCGQSHLLDTMDGTMLRCDQCELEYHQACVPAHVVYNSDRASRRSWFCSWRCEAIFRGLRALIGVENRLENGFSWMLLRSMKRDHGILPSNLEVMAEHNIKLSVAHGVMQECFVPMIDPRTKIDLISQALYNRRSKVARLNYSGFYTMLLEKGDEIISVATVRVHGPRLAEMPLVGTRYQYRRQGMCRRLMHALEKMLETLGVERLILPAVPELLETWIGAFKFQQMSLSEMGKLSKLNLMTFPGTTLLHKPLLSDTHDAELVQLTEEVQHCNEDSVVPSKPFEAVERPWPEGAALKHATDQPLVQTEKNCAPTMEKASHINYIHLNLGAVNQLEGLSSAVGQLPKVLASELAMESPSGVLMGRKDSKEDDVYNAKVVITTTRSKRLVRSSRWVADGLKELMKDASHSRRLPGMEECLDKAVQLDSPGRFKQTNGGHGSSQVITNVYVRTRRKVDALVAADNDATKLSHELSTSEHASTSDVSHCNQEVENTLLTDKSRLTTIKSNVENGAFSSHVSHSSVLDCLAFNTSKGSTSETKGNGDLMVVSTKPEPVGGTIFYSRRKRRDSKLEKEALPEESSQLAGQTFGSRKDECGNNFESCPVALSLMPEIKEDEGRCLT